MPARRGRGAFRLVLLGLTLIGFLALHGFVSPDESGAHCGPLDAVIADLYATDHDAAHAVPEAAPAMHLDGDDGLSFASSDGSSEGGHGLVTGCLIALAGALAALALRLLGRLGTHPSCPAVRPEPAGPGAARAPPHPLFLSLCVLRL